MRLVAWRVRGFGGAGREDLVGVLGRLFPQTSVKMVVKGVWRSSRIVGRRRGAEKKAKNGQM